MPVHPTCGNTFPNGTQAGHCAACCETFIGLVAFEAHRVGEHGTPDRRCETQPYETTTEEGKTRYGHWQDAKGYWHHGRKLTDEDKRKFGWTEA